MVSPIANNCLKLSIEVKLEQHLVPKLLLQVLVRELHNSMMSPPEEGGFKEARDADNNIIISDSTLPKFLSLQLNNTNCQYKVMCGCECLISSKIIRLSLLTWCDRCLKHLKNIS